MRWNVLSTTKTKHLIKAIVFCFGAAVMIAMSTFSLNLAPRENMTAFRQIPHNTIDVLVVGSSYSFCSISPMRLWEQNGIATFDMGASALRTGGTKAYLSYALRFQKPKVVAIEITTLALRDRVDPPYAITQFANFPLTLDKLQGVFLTVAPNSYEGVLLFPLSVSHHQWSGLTRSDLGKIFANGDEATYSRGFRAPHKVQPVELVAQGKTTDDEDQVPLRTNLPVLYEMVKKAKASGCEIVLFCGPNTSANSREILAESKNFLDKDFPNIRYLDMSEAIMDGTLDLAKDFYGSRHLNAIGAKKMTDWFQRNVLADYHLPNHSGDSSYAFWNDDLRVFLKKVPQTYSELIPIEKPTQ